MTDLLKLIITQIVVIVISSYIVIHVIEKHSVHPDYGHPILKDIKQINLGCTPEDAC